MVFDVLAVPPHPDPVPSVLLLCALSLALEIGFFFLFLLPVRQEVNWLKSKTRIDPLTQLGTAASFRSDIAQLSRCTSSLVALHIRLHRLDLRETKPGRFMDLVRAVRLLEAMLPRAADRLYRLDPTGATFGALLANGAELFGVRLAIAVIEGLRSQGLTATIAVASTENLGWCDLALAAAEACDRQVERQRGAWCTASKIPPKKTRPFQLPVLPPELVDSLMVARP